MLSCLELFAGAGGMSLGLARAGFDVLGVERDPDAVATHRSMVGPCMQTDVESGWLPKSKFDVVAGGPPCQSFSDSGKKLGFDDPRGGLFVYLLRSAQACGARAVVMENVKGITHRRNGAPPAIDHVLASFAAHGYPATYRILDAAHYGVGQNRQRVIIVGFRDPNDAARFVWPEPTHADPALGLPLVPWVTVRQALGLGLYKTGLIDGASGWNGQRMLDVDAPSPTIPTRGNAELLAPLDRPSPTLSAAENRSALTFGSKGAKTRPRRAGDVLNPALQALSVLDLPANAVSAGGTGSGGGVEIFPNKEYRAKLAAANGGKPVRLTLAQCAILQGFPPGFVFSGNTTSGHRQCGNALPPPLAEAVGRAVRAALEQAR